jgi:preprotein translocase subunit SecD/SecD/SecF fusion protein
VKKNKKVTFFLVFIFIILFALSAVFGVSYQYGDIKTSYILGASDIRLGIDIQGGVDVTFEPEDGQDATEEQMDAALEVIKLRLSSLNINDSETYLDYDSNRIIVRFPWQAGESDFNPEDAVKELGDMAELSFHYGSDSTTDEDGNAVPSGDTILTGSNVVNATTAAQKDDTTGDYEWVVSLEFDDEGTEAFATATSSLYESNGSISIWMDDQMISAPTVNSVISDGKCIIEGSFTYDSAKTLADQINSGALPFSLETTSFKTISPTLGTNSLYAMILAGLIALVLIAIYMIVLYRLPGFVSVIALIGQVAGTIACISGWFGFMSSSTLTIPGIAGIILAVGMGVDANIITNERIREELINGNSLELSLRKGYANAFSAILDGNLTTILISIVLMGAFGVPSSIFAKALNFVFFAFGSTTNSEIYSFGYTLMVGVILNLIMGVLATRLMVTSLSKFKAFKNPKLYASLKTHKSKEVEENA